MMVAELLKDRQRSRKRKYHHRRYRSKSKSRERSRSRSGGCWYHQLFGDRSTMMSITLFAEVGKRAYSARGTPVSCWYIGRLAGAVRAALSVRARARTRCASRVVDLVVEGDAAVPAPAPAAAATAAAAAAAAAAAVARTAAPRRAGAAGARREPRAVGSAVAAGARGRRRGGRGGAGRRRGGAGPPAQCLSAQHSSFSALNAASTSRHHHHQQQQQPRRRVRPARRQASSAAADRERLALSSGSSDDDDEEEEDSDERAEVRGVGADRRKQQQQPDNSRSAKEADAMQARLDWKLAVLYTLLVLQVLVVMIYVSSTPHMSDLNAPALRDAVSFVRLKAPQAYYENKTAEWRTIAGETSLRDMRAFRMFQAYDRTLCWREGVNDRRMRREASPGAAAGGPDQQQQQQLGERCACNQGWHGSDCGQPEVVWRAIMASKQNVQLRRRKVARRLVHTFYVHDHNSAIAEVIVEELYPVVDLFVVCDFSLAEDNFRHKLAKGFLGQQQDKILYVNVASKAHKPARVISKYVWERVKKVVKNIRDDDIYVSTDAEQILNARALMFLKMYDGWPQPIGFRLRWSVFGFFWQHPLRTTIAIGACTVGLMREAHRLNSLVLDKELTNEVGSEREALGLVIGDLNHYGGWYCQFCQGPANIIVALRERNRTREIALGVRSLDVAYVEDLIGTGTWFDDKTSLLRAHRSRESYYAPETVMNKTWKYDWLIENFYAKMDYY